jgi:hypothetical protein
MHPHHQDTIQRLTEHFQTNPQHLALIIGGSVAKGWAQENSDVDFMLVVSDEEYTRRAATRDYSIISGEFTDYPGGYVDGKVYNVNFLREVADHGSEPARFAFASAFPAFSRDAEIETLVKQIPVYPEAEREAKMRSFYSQFSLLNWFVGEAEKRGSAYLMMQSVSNMVLFGGRLILAYNRVLYPYHKWLMHVLEQVEDKPENFMPLVNTLLESPSKSNAQALTECLSQFHDWGITFPQTVAQFMEDSEWNWREHKPPVYDW